MTSHQQVRRPPTQAVYNDADTRMNRCSHPTQHPSLGATLELVSYVIKRDFFCHNTPLHDLSTRSFVRHSCLVAYLAHVVTLFNSSALYGNCLRCIAEIFALRAFIRSFVCTCMVIAPIFPRKSPLQCSRLHCSLSAPFHSAKHTVQVIHG